MEDAICCADILSKKKLHSLNDALNSVYFVCTYGIGSFNKKNVRLIFYLKMDQVF
jgi:hypothetical protein